MPVRKASAETSDLVSAATVDVPEGGHDFNLSVNAIDAAGAYLAAATGTAAIEFRSGVNDRWEALLDDYGDAVSIDLTAPETVSIKAAGLRQIRATPDGLTGAAVDGIRLAVWIF